MIELAVPVSRDGASLPFYRRLNVLWPLTRVIMLALCALYSGMRGDLRYYYAQAGRSDVMSSMAEYPFPVALWIMAAARTLPYAGFVALFVVTAIACDAVATRLFDRHFGREAALRWTLFVGLLGPLLYMRFDLYAAFALVLLLIFNDGAAHSRSRSVLSGLAVAMGSAVKLWPAVFGLGLLGPTRRRVTHMVAAMAGGIAWVGTTALLAGPQRVTSPLSWQGQRGFEVESLWGAWLGFARIFGSTPVSLEKRQGSWEYTGELANSLMWMVKPTQYVGYVLALSLLALGWRAGRDERVTTLALTMTCVISVLILSSPVLSPQYLIWLIPALVLVDDARLRLLGAVTLVLTQLEFPFLFDGIFSDHTLFALTTRVVILVRNMLLVWLTVRAVMLLVQRARVARRPASASSTPPATLA